MIKVGITGGIGSGKTIVCFVFQRLGVPVYDADSRAKYLLTSNKLISDSIKDRFGNDLYTNETLDRKKLADIVFNNPDALKDLNSIIHPAVKKDFEQWMKTIKAPYVIKEAAILFESGANKHLDKIITVTAPESLRIQRTMQRDNALEIEIKKRMSFQSSDEYKIQNSDFVIINDNNCLVFPQIIQIHEKIMSFKN